MSAFSCSVISYGNFSRGLRDGPNLYCLPPLAVLLDAGAAGAAAAIFLCCLRGGVLRRAEAAGAAATVFRFCLRGGGGGRYLLSMHWFSLEEEMLMQQSSISISLSFENQGINLVGDNAQVT